MPSSRRTLEYLYGLQYRGIKLGLRNIRLLLDSCENPHRRFPTIHVAGTNGKGSTCAFLASVLTESGRRTGLYTSPHLVHFTERIRIDGRRMEERRLVEYVDRLRPAIDRLRATFFEATTCIAFRYFADEHVDIAVIETGLGGRCDATNVLRPLVSVVTTIDLEHTELLGSTIRSIAGEKAGIIKHGIPVVTAVRQPEAIDVFREAARRRRSKVVLSREVAGVREREGRIRFAGRGLSCSLRSLPFRGQHQRENARLAFAALLLARGSLPPSRGEDITGEIVARGFQMAAVNSGLRGRLEILSKARLIADVAHNPAAMTMLVRSLGRLHLRPAAVVFGALLDKDVRSMLQSLGRTGARLVSVKPATDRGMAAAAVAREARALGLKVVPARSLRSALATARRLAGRRRMVLVTGSHYIVGPALALHASENP